MNALAAAVRQHRDVKQARPARAAERPEGQRPTSGLWDNTPSTSGLETSLGILFVAVICAAIVVLGAVFG